MALDFIDRCRPTDVQSWSAIHIDAEVKKRLIELLWNPEFHNVGYSAFINRACEAAEAEIAEKQRLDRPA